MNFENLNSAYFIGIGGIGMSALARYFNAKGISVSGYDKTSTKLTDELIDEGIKIHFHDDVDLIPVEILADQMDKKEQVLIVYTPAISNSNKELNYLKENSYSIKKRSEVLGLITHDMFTIAVAGTHGKTTTVSIITHLLKHSGYDCTSFLGGISVNYNTNYIQGDNNVIVVEADEFDRSFLTLRPDISVITSMDADHLDVYESKQNLEESFVSFAKNLKPGGKIIVHDQLKSKLANSLETTAQSYSISDSGDFRFVNIKVLQDSYGYSLDLVSPLGDYQDFTFSYRGSHNIENALAAVAVAQNLGIDNAKINEGLKTYKGVKRRFEIVHSSERTIYIDDYAHHPDEISAMAESVKELYPDKRVTVIFQPHLYSRTRDFMNEFASSLDLFDEVILLPIYPAREEPIEGITSDVLLEKLKCDHKSLLSEDELLSNIQNRKLEVLLTLGAGDIDQYVQPIKQILEN